MKQGLCRWLMNDHACKVNGANPALGRAGAVLPVRVFKLWCAMVRNDNTARHCGAVLRRAKAPVV
ncbi:MAG: hypothetical protein NXH82_11180 [Rhodobacteraceae bacterium]|nr:hypothetical protein [Paracoccaceae bacterium]